jgi:LacI family transcriptional regulator
MRTVALVAGVNASTVSRALRGVPGVSPAESKRIRTVARTLGYRPNPFIAALNAQRAATVASAT